MHLARAPSLCCVGRLAARAAEMQLRRDIEPQIGKLLSRFFDDFQVVFAPGREQEG